MKVKFAMLRNNHVKLLAILMLICITALTCRDVSASTSMPIGAFLRQPVMSVSALVKQVHTDTTVRSRYARLFNSQPDKVEMVFAGLHLAEMPRTGHFAICFIRPNGHLGFSLQKMIRGKLIFADSRGVPVLVQACGNPIKCGWPKEFELPYSATPYSDLQLEQSIVTIVSQDLLPPELRYNCPQEIHMISDVISVSAVETILQPHPTTISQSHPGSSPVTQEHDTLASSGIPGWIFHLMPPFRFVPLVAFPMHTRDPRAIVSLKVPLIPTLFSNSSIITSGFQPSFVAQSTEHPIEYTYSDAPTLSDFKSVADVPESGVVVLCSALISALFIFRRKCIKC